MRILTKNEHEIGFFKKGHNTKSWVYIGVQNKDDRMKISLEIVNFQ